MIPLRDANPTRRLPIVTLTLIAACTLVFLQELRIDTGGGGRLEAFFSTWAAVPDRVSAAVAGTGDPWAAARGVLGGMFIHGSWSHLLGNMLFLWIFGNNVEDRFGRFAFLGFYLAGGILATLAQVWIDPASTVPLVGASGAIAATLGAYIVLYPGARILSIVFLGFFLQVVEVPAIILLGFWFLLQLVDGLGSLGASSTSGGVAFFAHIGGFVAGALVGLVVREGGLGRRDQPPGWPS